MPEVVKHGGENNVKEVNIGTIYNTHKGQKIRKKGSRLRFYSFAVKSVLAGRTEGGRGNIATQPVIFDIAYTPHKLKKNATEMEIKKHRQQRAFYDMAGSDNIYKYITTEGKMLGEEVQKFTMLEYLQKSTGVFNQEGMLTKAEVKSMRKRAQTGEKNI